MPVIRINEENYNLLQAKARAEERPISWVLGRILTEHLKQIKKKQKIVHPDFSTLKDIYIDVWEKNNTINYQWSVVDATALNRLITSLSNSVLYIKGKTSKVDPNKIVDFFRAIMDNLPEFYKDKSINAINKNLNGIISTIKNGRNKSNKVQDGGQLDFRN